VAIAYLILAKKSFSTGDGELFAGAEKGDYQTQGKQQTSHSA